MLIVVADYLFIALALLLFLRSRSAGRAVAVMAATIAASAMSSAYLLQIWPGSEIAYTTLVLSTPLSVAAAVLWRFRALLPMRFILPLVAAPGTWSIWDLCGWPFERSMWRPEGVPVSWLYPTLFIGALLLWTRLQSAVVLHETAAEQAAAADERHGKTE